MAEPRDSQLQGNWEQMKGRLRESWGALTDDDVARAEGNWERTVGVIRERTGETTDAVERKLNELLDSVK